MSEPVPATFHHVGISVADLDGMVGWYQDVLGLDQITHRQEIPEHGVRVAILQASNGLGVELIEHAQSKRLGHYTSPLDELRGRGYAHWAMQVSDLEAAYGRLTDAGADGIWPAGQLPNPTNGIRVAFIRDPEGNTIELMQFTGASDPAGHAER